MQVVLEETGIGQALGTFWQNMPKLVLGNILFSCGVLSISMVSNRTFSLILLWAILPPLITFLAWLVYPFPLQFGDFSKKHYPITCSIILGYSLIAFIQPSAMRYLLVVFWSIIIPFCLCLPLQYTPNLGTTWQNALVLAIHHPIYGLGLCCLGGLFFLLTWLTHGAGFLIAPTLWLTIARQTTQELIQEFEKNTLPNF